MSKRTYAITFRCKYRNGGETSHRQVMPLSDIAKRIEAYVFTHPEVWSITAKIWPQDKEVEA